MASATSVVLLDGGLATELEHRGFVIQDDPLWSARLLSSAPNAIKDVHKSYLASGADIITTASYQASISGFMEYLNVGKAEAESLVIRSVELARQAIEEHLANRVEIPHFKLCLQAFEDSRQIEINGVVHCCPLIAGSIGPYGACLHNGSEYTGSYVDTVTKQELEVWHHQRIALLYEAGLRLFACETIPAQMEAEAVIEVMSKFADALCWISFSCKDDLHLCHGETFVDAVSSVVQSRQVVAVGVNCTAPWLVEPLMKSVCACSAGRLLVAYPNSGEDWVNSRWQKSESSSMPLENYLQCWIDAGARLIGGCCRTGPDVIEKFRQTIDLQQ